MAKDTSPFVVGEYWLDKRRDGKAGNVWQIARYSAASRSIIYRSTKRGDLEDAKGVLLAFVNQERAKGSQTAEEAGELTQQIGRATWRERVCRWSRSRWAPDN